MVSAAVRAVCTGLDGYHVRGVSVDEDHDYGYYYGGLMEECDGMLGGAEVGNCPMWNCGLYFFLGLRRREGTMLV